MCGVLAESNLIDYRREDDSVKLDERLKELLLEPDEPA